MKSWHFTGADSWYLARIQTRCLVSRSIQHYCYTTLHSISVCLTPLTLTKLSVPSVYYYYYYYCCLWVNKVLCTLDEKKKANCSLWGKHTGFIGCWRNAKIAHVHECAHTPCLVLPHLAWFCSDAMLIRWFKIMLLRDQETSCTAVYWNAGYWRLVDQTLHGLDSVVQKFTAGIPEDFFLLPHEMMSIV